MSSKADSKSSSSSLQRGKACLRCRKRKMRCDATKPSCQQCVRAKKGDSCEYDDGKGKTRTQLLREKVETLEKKVKELEDPDNLVPAMALYDPGHSHRNMSESSSSGYGSPGAAGEISFSHSPFGTESTHSPQSSWVNLPGLIRTTSPFNDILYDDPAQTAFQPSVDLARMLLDIFAPHRHQCGLQINMLELRESLTRPPSEQRHPVLMNSIYLWACFVSRPEALCQHEEYYLTHALDALRDALRQGDRVLDILQGSCLLALYFFANGRTREGSYHAGAAAAFAVQHQLHHGLLYDQSLESPTHRSSLPDTQSWERINAFWQVFNIDRCWSVVLQTPAFIADGPDAWLSINCPWPQDETQYEAAPLEHEVSFQTVRGFFNGEVSPSGFSPLAIRAKASALFQKANAIAMSWDPRTTTTDVIREEIRVMDLTIMSFIAGLVPLHQLDSTLPETKQTLITAYTLANSASIHLYRRFAKEDAVSYDKCLQAARAIVAVTRAIAGLDFDFLDPIIGHCWSAASEPLIHELNRCGTSWAVMNEPDVRNDLGILLYALNSLSTKFPVLSLFASKLQTRLSEV